MSFPVLIANKILHVTVLVLLRSVCDTGNSSQQMSLQCLSTINIVFIDKDKILIRSLYLKGHTAVRLTDEFQRWVFLKIENRLRFDKVTESLMVGTFLRHSVFQLHRIKSK